ncbi:MAG: hypothetical protein HDT44_01170 [Ruminococcaceae bacterium]|nr:hypothetical protein [Oscillospiraceae bacterium]
MGTAGTTRGITVFGLLIISVIVIGAIALLIYFLVYKSAINKRVTNQSGETKPKRMPAPSSAAYTVLAIAVAAIMIGVWIDIKNSTENLSNLCYQLSEKVGRLQAREDYLESEILSLSDELKKEQGLFTSVDISYGEPDYGNHSVKVKITASPKSSTDDTEIVVRLGDMSVKLAKTNVGVYSCEIEFDLYKVYNDDMALITITENGQVRSEELDFDANDLVFKCGARLSENLTVHEYEYLSEKLSMSIWTNSGLFEDFFDNDSYKLTVKSDGNVILEEPVVPGIEKNCEVEIKGEAEAYLSAVDKCGNTHICRFYFEDVAWGSEISYGSEEVLDSRGNLIVEY